jgi:hypothetical protein
MPPSAAPHGNENIAVVLVVVAASDRGRGAEEDDLQRRYEILRAQV